MMSDLDPIKAAQEIAENSLVPELAVDLTTTDVKSDDFKEFREYLRLNLYMLFDIISRNQVGENLFENEKETKLFRINLLRVLCEQSSVCDLFKCNDQGIQENVLKILNDYFTKYYETDEVLICSVFDVYKAKLNNNAWKKNIGSIYGFLRFCQIFYKDIKEPTLDNSNIYSDRCMFILAIGTNLCEYHDPQYKEIGLALYNILLSKMSETTIKEMNIHEVIITTVFPNIHKVQEKRLNCIIWDCLYSCMKFLKIRDPTKWNKLDDILTELINVIMCESDREHTLKLLTFLNLFTSLNLRHLKEVQQATDRNKIERNLKVYQIDEDESLLESISELRIVCKKTANVMTYRWVKRLLALYLSEARCICHEPKSTVLFLYVIHVNFLISVYSVPPEIMQKKLIDFIDEFMKMLILIVKGKHQNEESVLKMSYSILETFEPYLRSIPEENLDPVLETYRDGITMFMEYKRAPKV